MAIKAGFKEGEPYYLVTKRHKGSRVQLHFDRATEKLQLFSKSLQDLSGSFKRTVGDLLRELCQHSKLQSIVLDTVLTQQPLRLHAFDILFLDGTSLLREGLCKRWGLLKGALTGVPAGISIV